METKKVFTSHFGAGDEDEVLPPFSFEIGHALRLEVVSGHLERKDLKTLQTWCHRKYTCAVSAIVKVTIWCDGFVRVRDACRVSADNVKIRTGYHTAFGVPLHLKPAN